MDILNCMYNCILYIYYSLQSLSQLRVLDLSDNYLKKVPSVVGEINTLNELNLRDCGLKDLPPRLVQIGFDFTKLFLENV